MEISAANTALRAASLKAVYAVPQGNAARQSEAALAPQGQDSSRVSLSREGMAKAAAEKVAVAAPAVQGSPGLPSGSEANGIAQTYIDAYRTQQQSRGVEGAQGAQIPAAPTSLSLTAESPAGSSKPAFAAGVAPPVASRPAQREAGMERQNEDRPRDFQAQLDRSQQNAREQATSFNAGPFSFGVSFYKGVFAL